MNSTITATADRAASQLQEHGRAAERAREDLEAARAAYQHLLAVQDVADVVGQALGVRPGGAR